MDLSQLMAEDTAKKTIALPSDIDLQVVSDLANEQLRLEEIVAIQEEELKHLKEQLTSVREVKLPAALESMGLLSLTLSDGSTVTIKEEIYAGITEQNREAAFNWLESTDNDGIIKNEIKCPFGKGQDSEAKKLTELLANNGFSFVNSRSVHPQTLKAFVRKQLEDALPIPTDIFSIHLKNVAIISLPRKR